MKKIKLFEYTKDFAENKDVARALRIEKIDPELKKGNEITIDFNKVESATQSFVHALISQSIREMGESAIDKIYFKNCNSKIQTIIKIVLQYVQDGLNTDQPEEKIE